MTSTQRDKPKSLTVALRHPALMVVASHRRRGLFLWCALVASILAAGLLLRDDIGSRHRHLLSLAIQAEQLRDGFLDNHHGSDQQALAAALTLAHREADLLTGYYPVVASWLYRHELQDTTGRIRHALLTVVALAIENHLRATVQQLAKNPVTASLNDALRASADFYDQLRNLQSHHSHWNQFLRGNLQGLDHLLSALHPVSLPALWLKDDSLAIKSVSIASAQLFAHPASRQSMMLRATAMLENLSFYGGHWHDILPVMQSFTDQSHALVELGEQIGHVPLTGWRHMLTVMNRNWQLMDHWATHSEQWHHQEQRMMEVFFDNMRAISLLGDEAEEQLKRHYNQTHKKRKAQLMRSMTLLGEPLFHENDTGGYRLSDGSRDSWLALSQLLHVTAQINMNHNPVPSLQKVAVSSLQVNWQQHLLDEAVRDARQLLHHLTVPLNSLPQGWQSVLSNFAYGVMNHELARMVGRAWTYDQSAIGAQRQNYHAVKNILRRHLVASHQLSHLLAFEKSLQHQMMSYGMDTSQQSESLLGWMVTSWAYRHMEYASESLRHSAVLRLPSSFVLGDGGYQKVAAQLGTTDLQQWLQQQKNQLHEWVTLVTPYAQLVQKDGWKNDGWNGDDTLPPYALLDSLMDDAIFMANFDGWVEKSTQYRKEPMCNVWFPFAPSGVEQTDFVHQRFSRWQHQLFSLCQNFADYRDAATRYQSLAAAFNQGLAGKYPFAPLAAADHSLLDVYDFFSRWGDDIDWLYDDVMHHVAQGGDFDRSIAVFLLSLRHALHILQAIAPIDSLPLQLRFDIGKVTASPSGHFFKALYVSSGMHRLSLSEGVARMDLQAGDGIDLALAWGTRGSDDSTAWYEDAIHRRQQRMAQERYASHGSWGLLRLIERYGALSQESTVGDGATALLRLPMAEMDGRKTDLLVRMDIERGTRALALDLVEGIPFPHVAPSLVSAPMAFAGAR